MCNESAPCCTGYTCCEGECIRGICSCTGNIQLNEQFTKSYVTNFSAGADVQLTICGLSKSCENETVYIKTINCESGNRLSSFSPSFLDSCNSYGGTASFFINYGSHKICACIDKNKDGNFNGIGETSCRTFKICHSNLLEDCSSNEMCCSGICSNGKCCIAENQPCVSNSECCTNFCSNGTCKEIPVTVCAGQTKLDLPETTSPQKSVTAYVYGLNSLCSGRTFYFKLQNCSGETIFSSVLGSNGTRSFNFQAPSTIGTYTYAVCVDISGNGTFERTDEYAKRDIRVCYALGERCESDSECCNNVCSYYCGACTGDVDLSFSAYNVTKNAMVTATITGLSSRCMNRTIELRMSNCIGTLVKSCNVNLSFCDGTNCTYGCQFSFNAPSQNGTYRYFAFLDLDLDGFVCESEKEYGWADIHVE
jgi:hypothetical protein